MSDIVSHLDTFVKRAHDAKMIKLAAIALRLPTETKQAIEKAALDEQRSVSNLVERVMTEWLRERGYLPEAKRKTK